MNFCSVLALTDVATRFRGLFEREKSWRCPAPVARKPKQAIAFYSVLALSVVLSIGLNFTSIDPVKALYWSAVINGALAAPSWSC